MGKLKDWWNKPITNGTIVGRQIKSTAYTLLGWYILNKIIDYKFSHICDDDVINVEAEIIDEEVKD